jgi:hypothetical protein
MKVEIEIRDDIVRGIYCEFCEQYGLELTEPQEKLAMEICLQLLIAEIVDNGADDCASMIDPKDVKYKLGSNFWKKVMEND